MRAWFLLLLLPVAPVWAAEVPRLFKPPHRPDVPAVKGATGPVDAFIVARLRGKGLSLNRPADRATLLRRLAFDLTGLPPTPDEQDAFLADRRPDAYEHLVDRLLASSAFGERWALHWLDLVRYAESDGFNADALRPEAHRYRDWVIRALNADTPYDRFVQHQLAGDELAPGDRDALIAAGFLRLYPDEHNAAQLEQRRQEIIDDITDTAGLVFLGLTVGCARCHDHKYDPITQKDYFRLQSFFAPLRERTAPLDDPKSKERLAAWEKATSEVREEMERLLANQRVKEAERGLSRFNADIQFAFRTPASKRTPFQEQIAAMAMKQVRAYEGMAPGRLPAELKKRHAALEKKLAAFGPRPYVPTTLTVVDVGKVAPPTHRLIGGDWRKPASEVRPGFPASLGGGEPDTRLPSSVVSTGRRAALARWLTWPDHPLTARVIVNRLWQQLTGQGIVATPSDFGVQGTPPTHPELLDWLAVELVESGWSLKHIVRLIVLSDAYRQSSLVGEEHARALAVDRGNNLLWHMRRRRLEGETIRDAVLSVSGELNRRPFGPSARPELPADAGRYGWKADADPSERNRRSVYVLARRNLRFPLFDAFDQPDLCTSTSRRLGTTTAPQALALLNNPVLRGHARAWADRLRGLGEEPDALIRAACRMAWGREPDDEEMRLGRAFLAKRTLADLCHALLNTNAFLYVD